MLLDKDKALILAGLVLALGLLVATGLVFRPGFWKNPNVNGNVTAEKEITPKSNVPQNVFWPSFERPKEYGNPGQPQSESVPRIPKELANQPSFQTSFPSLEDLKSLISSSSPSYFTPTSPKEELLPLPSVLDSEITVDARGVSDIKEYFRYLAIHYQDVNFDYKKLNTIIGKDDKFYPSPTTLIDRALEAGDLVSVLPSLDVLKEFAIAKIEFEKRIKVANTAISYARTMIGLDKLTLQLIDKFDELSTGTSTRADFENFYGKYKNTGKFYGESFLKAGGLAGAIGDDNNVFSKILGFLGFRNVAQAQLPLGGPVVLQTICTCSFVGAITVGPPAGGSFALPPFFALFPNFSPTIGHFVLGLYESTPIPCLQFVLLACIPDPLIPATFGPVIMMGTS